MFSKGSPLNPPRGDLLMQFQKVFSIYFKYAAFCRDRVYYVFV